MLYNLDWLETGKSFPPSTECPRLEKYDENANLFAGGKYVEENMYTRRISRVIGNFEEVISFPMIFNYQKLMSLKMADLICGEYPSVAVSDDVQTGVLNDLLEESEFNAKLYSTVIDISRYGDAVWRIFRGEDGLNTFTVWDPHEWFPIVMNDGTNRVLCHVLCWVENRGTDDVPDYYLASQIHYTGYYIYRVFHWQNKSGALGDQVDNDVRVNTGLTTNAVMHIKAFSTTDTIYGYDDYTAVDIVVRELETRCAQISSILDKHADPSLCGPTSLLSTDPVTSERTFKRGRFYACSPDDMEPRYLTWDGQLESSFKQIEVLLGQLYVLSEMGAVLAGANEGSLQAVSAQAMRYKMITPLAKARRISNALTRPVKRLIEALAATSSEVKDIKAKDITVNWQDGLPDDPREQLEYAKLACGENKIMPLKTVLTQVLRRSKDDAEKYIVEIDKRTLALQEMEASVQANLDSEDPENTNGKPGPNAGTVKSAKGSTQGVSNPKSPKNA